MFGFIDIVKTRIRHKTNHKKFFEEIFKQFNIHENIINRLVNKQEKHGDEWIFTSKKDLYKRIDYLYNTYKGREEILDLEQKGILDLINMGILLLIKMKSRMNFLKEFD